MPEKNMRIIKPTELQMKAQLKLISFVHFQYLVIKNQKPKIKYA